MTPHNSAQVLASLDELGRSYFGTRVQLTMADAAATIRALADDCASAKRAADDLAARLWQTQTRLRALEADFERYGYAHEDGCEDGCGHYLCSCGLEAARNRWELESK